MSLWASSWGNAHKGIEVGVPLPKLRVNFKESSGPEKQTGEHVVGGYTNRSEGHLWKIIFSNMHLHNIPYIRECIFNLLISRSEGFTRTGLFHPWTRWGRGPAVGKSSVSSSRVVVARPGRDAAGGGARTSYEGNIYGCLHFFF